jgi:hypothetical protein
MCLHCSVTEQILECTIYIDFHINYQISKKDRCGVKNAHIQKSEYLGPTLVSWESLEEVTLPIFAKIVTSLLCKVMLTWGCHRIQWPLLWSPLCVTDDVVLSGSWPWCHTPGSLAARECLQVGTPPSQLLLLLPTLAPYSYPVNIWQVFPNILTSGITTTHSASPLFHLLVTSRNAHDHSEGPL